MRNKSFFLLTFLFAITSVTIASASGFNSETLDFGPSIIYEEKTETNLDKINISDIATDYSSQINVTTDQSQPVASSAQSNIGSLISTSTQDYPLFVVTDYIAACNNVNCFTSKDAERGIVQYQNTFYYGHSSIAFDRLKTTYVGNIIRVQDANGTVHTYQITQRLVKTREYLNGSGKTDGFTSGVYKAIYNEVQYSAAFMTCGNGSNNDSNYRLILFANEI